jgi:hypothetical protein
MGTGFTGPQASQIALVSGWKQLVLQEAKCQAFESQQEMSLLCITFSDIWHLRAIELALPAVATHGHKKAAPVQSGFIHVAGCGKYSSTPAPSS